MRSKALVIFLREKGRSLESHWKYESSNIWRTWAPPKPHTYNLSTIQPFSRPTWKPSEQTHRGLGTKACIQESPRYIWVINTKQLEHWCQAIWKQKCKMFSVYNLPESDPPPKILSSLILVKRRNRRENAIQFRSSVVSNSLWPHEPQHARPPCPSPTPRVHPNPCPLSWWCQPTISSSVIPFSSFPHSFPASGSFHIRWPKYWSFSFKISPSNENPGLIFFRMDWLDLLAVQGVSRVFSNTTVQKHQFFGTQLFL